MEDIFSRTGMQPMGEDARARIARELFSRVQGASQPTRDTAGYVAEGLPANYEGLGDAYALKYGQKGLVDALMQLQQGGARGMTAEEMRAMEQQMGQAGREYDNMWTRENIRFRGGQNWGRFGR